MKHANRRLVIFGIGLLAAAAMGCGEQGPTPPPGLTDAHRAGWQTYVDLNCASCHGDEREGKRSGPELAELDQHWNETLLVSYLENPDAMIKTTPRLAYKAERYAIAMPAFAGKADTGQLTALAGFLLVDFE